VTEFKAVGLLIAEVLDAVSAAGDGDTSGVEKRVKAKVASLTSKFPIYRSY
jgi:glycine hydroxymethyltransferase